MSNKGEVQWNVPAEWEEQMTFEERAAGPDLNGDDVINLIKACSDDSSWEAFCKFGHGYLLSSPGASRSVAKAVKSAIDKIPGRLDEEGQVRYHIHSHQTEEDMNQTEVSSHDLVRASAEAVSQSVFWDEGISEEEREKWLHGLQKESDTVSEKEVLKAVTREEAQEAWSLSSVAELPKPVPRKLVLTRKPDLSSCAAEPSASAAADAVQNAWTAKVRLVACGNFQEDTSPHMLENSFSNPSQEVFRLLLSMLARHCDWTAMILDISCAFLNALLGNERVLIRPSPVLVRLGLLSPNILWIALRAIYGLRKSPKLWEEERNRTLDNRVLNLSTGNESWSQLKMGPGF